MTNANDLVQFSLDSSLANGLTKREYFASINNDPVPDLFCLQYIRNKEKGRANGYRKTEGKYWDILNPDEKAEVRALWKVKSADALIKALNENPDGSQHNS